MGKIKILLPLLLIIFIIIGVPSDSLAVITSGRIDSALIELKDKTIVSVDYTEFKDALRYKSGLFNYLAIENGNGIMKVHGVVSGEKFISYSVYKDVLRYQASKSVATAINLSTEITSTGFLRLTINKDGTFTTAPIITVPTVTEFKVVDIY